MARGLAVLIDVCIQFGVIAAFSFFMLIFGAFGGGNVAIGLMLIGWFVIYWFYYVFFEAGKRNATPGKRAMGLRVARTSGAPPNLMQIVVRNFLRFVDLMPFFVTSFVPSYAIGLTACVFTRNFQRIGDLAANTVVLYNDRETPQVALRLDQITPLAPAIPLTREEQLSITNFLERIPDWSGDRRREMADIMEPLTGATGEEGVRRLLGIGLWIRSDTQERPQLF